MEGQGKYRDYRIDFSYGRDTTRIGTYVCAYLIYRNNELQFSFDCSANEQYLHRFPDREGLSKLIDDGFDLACGLIDTEKYKKFKELELPEFDGEEYELSDKSEIPYADIRHEILKALRKIRLENEKTFETADFNEDGFCKVLRITKDDFSYGIGCLKEEGLIKIKNGKKSITIKGIKELEQNRN